MTYNWGLAVDTWYHIAVIRGWGGVASNWALTINGTAVATDTYAGAHSDFADDLEIGALSTTGAVFKGWLDEYRVTKGTARWTANFSPPSSQYPFGDNSGTVYEVETTYTEVALPNLQYVQSADVMYNVHESFVVRKLTRTGHANWAIANVSFTDAPAAWSAGDYPRTTEFYEDRLCFGGSPDQPDTV